MHRFHEHVAAVGDKSREELYENRSSDLASNQMVKMFALTYESRLRQARSGS